VAETRGAMANEHSTRPKGGAVDGGGRDGTTGFPDPGAPLALLHLDDRDDGRGSALYLPDAALAWLGGVAEVHLVTARRLAIRGNHVHHRRRELILIRAAGPWELAWRPPGGGTIRRRFDGPDTVLLAVAPGTAHAIENLADEELIISSCSNGRYDPDDPDTERVVLIEAPV